MKEDRLDNLRAFEASSLPIKLELEKHGTSRLTKVMSDIRSMVGGLFETKDVKILNYLVRLYDDKEITTRDIVEIIRADHNILSAYVVKDLIAKEIISKRDLERYIEKPFLEALFNDQLKGVMLKSSAKLEKISRKSTEVYFWGIPSSGKTCALGAILSEAYNGSTAKSMERHSCQGFDYMNQLSGIFSHHNEVGVLPSATGASDFYEMCFDLEDEKSKIHPITCIDLAGELVNIMYKANAQMRLNPESEDSKALKTLDNLLISNRTINPKIHFFVIEYGGHNRKNSFGVTQADCLSSSLTYLKNLGIFQKDTVAIYVLLTKADMVDVKDKTAHLKKYVATYYSGFMKQAQKVCREFEINNGVVTFIPFSLGEVCFQNYCKFDATKAKEVVEIMIKRSVGKSTTRFQKVLDWLGL